MANNNLTVIDGETLADMRLPPAQYCVKSLLHQGVTILGGAPKIGKSWLVLDLCVRVAKGESVFGLEVKRGTTLYNIYLALQKYPPQIRPPGQPQRPQPSSHGGESLNCGRHRPRHRRRPPGSLSSQHDPGHLHPRLRQEQTRRQ